LSKKRVQGVLLSTMTRRPEVQCKALLETYLPEYLDSPEYTSLDPYLQREVIEQVETQIKYAGYLDRQKEEVRRFQSIEDIHIPDRFQYQGIPGLSHEIVEKLTRVHPLSLGQASRVPGITPAALNILMIYLRRFPHESLTA